MARRRYRWNPDTCQQELIAETESKTYGLTIMADIPDFVSPVDGRVVHGRRGLREHNRELDVTNTADYTNEWAEKARERERFYSGDPAIGRAERIEAIKEAFEKHRRT